MNFNDINIGRLVAEIGDKGFSPLAFMGIGMLGVLIIVGVIMLSTYAINATINRLAAVKAAENEEGGEE